MKDDYLEFLLEISRVLERSNRLYMNRDYIINLILEELGKRKGGNDETQETFSSQQEASS